MGLFVSPLVVNVPEQTYSGSITWTASAAPSGSTTHTYEWSLIGGIWVLLRMNLLYGSGGSTATVVTMVLPSDCPNPKIPSGFNAADTNLYVGSGIISTSTSTTGAQVDRCYLRTNSGNNGFLVAVYASASNNPSAVFAAIFYPVA